MKKKIIIGFTGTSKEISLIQKMNLRYKLKHYCKIYKKVEVHHGDCIGADCEFHKIAKRLKVKVIIHPPINPKSRAFCKSKFILNEKEYLDRNKDIVNSCNILFATPEDDIEKLRSGTWSTIRYARKTNKNIIIFYFSNRVVKEINEITNALMKIYSPTKKGVTKGEYKLNDRCLFFNGEAIIFDSVTKKCIEPFSLAKIDSYWQFEKEVPYLELKPTNMYGLKEIKKLPFINWIN